MESNQERTTNPKKSLCARLLPTSILASITTLVGAAAGYTFTHSDVGALYGAGIGLAAGAAIRYACS